IGSSLEAKVVLGATPQRYETLRTYETDLPALCIVSQVELSKVEAIPTEGHLLSDPSFGLYVDVEKPSGAKCERCWNYRIAVGTRAEHPPLCYRCVQPIRRPSRSFAIFSLRSSSARSSLSINSPSFRSCRTCRCMNRFPSFQICSVSHISGIPGLRLAY